MLERRVLITSASALGQKGKAYVGRVWALVINRRQADTAMDAASVTILCSKKDPRHF